VDRNHSKGVTITTSVHGSVPAGLLPRTMLQLHCLGRTKHPFFSTPRQWPNIAVYKIYVRKLYKSCLDILSKNLYYWVELVLWRDIRDLMTKQSRIRISPLSFYLIKIKYKIVWVYTSSSSKRFYLRKFVRKLYKSYIEVSSNSLKC
jgi:hypothetical protein